MDLVPSTTARWLPVGRNIVTPPYLDATDHPWLQLLLEEFHRFTGQRWRDLDEALKQALPFAIPEPKRSPTLHTLRRVWATRTQAVLPPRQLRTALFSTAARDYADTSVTMSRVAATLGLSSEELQEGLFADLPAERRVCPPADVLTPAILAAATNLAMIQNILHRATHVALEVWGNARPIVRHAKLRGLLCSIAAANRQDGVKLSISGPLSLFRRTLMYGRALAELVPYLPWCRRFHLDATLDWRGAGARMVLSSGALITPGAQPRSYDSKVEERFARAFQRKALAWHLIREPAPLQVGSTLCFPDFLLVHRTRPNLRWWLEIVGFWTPEYLHRKLQVLRQARLENLILCVDAARNCAEADFPPMARVLRYKSTIAVPEVLAAIEPGS